MADLGFRVKIVTPQEVFFTGQAISLIAPGHEGYLGILKNHAPLVTPLVDGIITIRGGDQDNRFKIRGGFLEVSRNEVLILAEDVSEAEVPVLTS